jgi:D-alanyl-D-alanine carboxypeptidase (penicillin-binding protein 5/6)
MRVPALATIAAESTAVVPVAGLIRSTNAVLGQDAIVGLKTGSTQAAGGCFLVAAWPEVNGHRTLVVAAAFGQPGPARTTLPNALQAGRNLVLALQTALAALAARQETERASSAATVIPSRASSSARSLPGSPA